MNFLGYKVDMQEVFSIFNSEYKNIKYKKNKKSLIERKNK